MYTGIFAILFPAFVIAQAQAAISREKRLFALKAELTRFTMSNKRA
jgi:hypothetical protein